MTPEELNIEVPLDAVSPDYFKVMGIPLLRGGRSRRPTTSRRRQVVIINESMARRFWPNEDAVGKRFRYGGGQSTAPLMTVVGVVADMRRTRIRRAGALRDIPPAHAARRRSSSRSSCVPPASRSPWSHAVRAQLRSIDPEQPVFEIASMDQLLSSMVAQRRFSMALLGTFAALALVLGVVGVYGVTSYLVAQRTREVGVRLALGAQPSQVVGMVVRQGMVVAGLGLAVGLAGAIVAGRFMTGLLYGVGPFDIATLAGVTP